MILKNKKLNSKLKCKKLVNKNHKLNKKLKIIKRKNYPMLINCMSLLF